MCSIVMPADYEMLVSHSPPIFSHSPPSHGFLNRCDSYPRMTRFYKSPSRASPPKADTPTRPILIVRPECSSSDDSNDDDPVSPTRLKKKVVFADDRGMSLTQVRVMTEPSNVPPVWSFRFLSQVTKGIQAEPLAHEEPWELTFSQPASDYVAFRKRLDADKVTLENVIVKESEELVVGTVKVCNIAFEKEVSLRTTDDDWKTHKDIQCTYMPGMASSSAYALYDTFSFKFPLPTDSRRLEFCVLYTCNNQEYWDNNFGGNYKIVKNKVTSRHLASEPQIIPTSKTRDIFNTKVDSWSEFASWNHLDVSSPYW
ncbi:protein phosphatase 1 regulatory subunit 3B-like [Atheta coriaria]|uniref:protein phosphatase 1 regulatory subunit 3B-like n=1 Tax=Dalotia coriaria TaxID=877792 RepID=UPI0031F4110D